jgi:hypothetical protein
MPPKSARRRACGNVDNANALPKVPQENKRRKSGHVICYQNRTSSFAIDTLNGWGSRSDAYSQGGLVEDASMALRP